MSYLYKKSELIMLIITMKVLKIDKLQLNSSYIKRGTLFAFYFFFLKKLYV
ncbi:hypothetical protein KR50_20590 [Jeotgalibacillus campisalis]|uniref:Uncharacterized protein n=1 Tax=Jeotgalibacillus campisalis TaxID=220754 RepID=A0A0C2VG76_9BACL|nr:hypothetical protein KR50_20590 [Jeotgalibacillus campisalis]